MAENNAPPEQEENDDEKEEFAGLPRTPTKDDEQRKKQLKLKDCTLKIVSCGKRTKTDSYMVLDLEFTLLGLPPKLVELPYTPEGMKNALMHCNNALDTFIFVDDCHYKDQQKTFGELIHQEIERFKERTGVNAGSRKEKISVNKPSVEKIDGKYYFISKTIYLLSGEVRELTEKEIEDLPVLISWDGPDTSYDINREECLRLLVKILKNFNLLQNRKFVSFPLAVFVAHLAGCLYKHIINEQGNYASQMFISGEVHGTGKSLMRTLMMLMILGETRPPTRNLTEHTFYQMLSTGVSIYVNEFCLKRRDRATEIDAKFYGTCVQNLWERTEKISKGVTYRLNGVMHVDANIMPKDLEPYLNPATLSKIMFNHSGPIPLRHPHKTDIIKELKADSEKIHKYLPYLFYMGVKLTIPIAGDLEANAIDQLLKEPGDPREAQRIVIYDRVYMFIKEAIEEFGFEKPALFEAMDIDRTSLLYCNYDEEDYIKYEDLAKQAVDVCENNLNVDLVESGRSGSYKVDCIENVVFTAEDQLVSDLKKLITPSHTTFNGIKRSKGVIVFSEAFITEETATRLKNLSCRYTFWSRPISSTEEFANMTYGTKFYTRVEMDRTYDETVSTRSGPKMEGIHEKTGGQKRKIKPNEDLMEQEKVETLDTSLEADVDDQEETSLRKKKVNLDSDETFKCKQFGCKKYGVDFKTMSNLIKHEALQYHIKASTTLKSRKK